MFLNMGQVLVIIAKRAGRAAWLAVAVGSTAAGPPGRALKNRGGVACNIQKLKMKNRGFTLIELMIVVVIVSVLAAIALPSYSSYLVKQRMRAAQADLVALAANMENMFQRTLAYPPATATTAETKAALAAWQPSDDKLFEFQISASTTETYTVQAVGKSALSGCTISLTQANVRTTSGCSQGGGSWL